MRGREREGAYGRREGREGEGGVPCIDSWDPPVHSLRVKLNHATEFQCCHV